MQSLAIRLIRRIAAFFVAGLLAILPVVITVAIVIWVTSFLRVYLGPEATLGSLLTNLGMTVRRDSTTPYLFGWIAVLCVVFALGVIVELGAKVFFQRLIDRLFKRIPLIGSIYSTSKQVVEMLDQKEGDAMKGMSPVFCLFGESQTAVLAFLVSPERFQVGQRDYHIVIIPTAPLPFGGAMLFVPVESVIRTQMPVDGLMSIYLSMGVTAPEFLTGSAKK